MALVHTPPGEIGSPIPNFSLLGVDQKQHALKDYSGRPALVVMFICNHCPYVKAIEDRLIQLGHDLNELDVPLVAICANDSENYPDDSFENLRARAQLKNYSFPYLHDEDQQVAKKFGAVCTPDFFVYDRDLKLQYRGRLDDSWKDPSAVRNRELYEFTKALVHGEKTPEQQHSSMGCSIKWRES